MKNFIHNASHCLSEIKMWLNFMFSKLNKDNTKLLRFTMNKKLHLNCRYWSICCAVDKICNPSWNDDPKMKYLAIRLDPDLSMAKYKLITSKDIPLVL